MTHKKIFRVLALAAFVAMVVIAPLQAATDCQKQAAAGCQKPRSRSFFRRAKTRLNATPTPASARGRGGE